MILLSNSLPKSGSTYLCSLQREIVTVCRGLSGFKYDELESYGVRHVGSFVTNPNESSFLGLLREHSENKVYKIHSVIGGRLESAIIESEHIFHSMIVRDPVDIFFSATRNYLATGEFGQFSSTEGGLLQTKKWLSIFESALKLERLGHTTIVRYEKLIEDPLNVGLQSLPSFIRDEFRKQDQPLDLQKVHQAAKHRLGSKGFSAGLQIPSRDLVRERLHEIRVALGYAE